MSILRYTVDIVRNAVDFCTRVFSRCGKTTLLVEGVSVGPSIFLIGLLGATYAVYTALLLLRFLTTNIFGHLVVVCGILVIGT